MKKKTIKTVCLTILVLVIGALIFRDKIGVAIRQYHFTQSIPKESRLRGPAAEGPLDILPGEKYTMDFVTGDVNSFETFSIYPNQELHDSSVGYEISRTTVFQGIVSNDYFSHNKVRVNLLDANKNILALTKAKYIWRAGGDMSGFQGNLDFNDEELPNGPAFIEIQSRNDVARSIFIPVVINN